MGTKEPDVPAACLRMNSAMRGWSHRFVLFITPLWNRGKGLPMRDIMDAESFLPVPLWDPSRLAAVLPFSGFLNMGAVCLILSSAVLRRRPAVPLLPAPKLKSGIWLFYIHLSSGTHNRCSKTLFFLEIYDTIIAIFNSTANESITLQGSGRKKTSDGS